ncbi:unnamed protein product [Sympodiomycopsis kandeliae]
MVTDPDPSDALPSSPIQLRPYQERAVTECLNAINSGITRIGVSAPTGSGKTTMFTELIGRLPSRPHHSGHKDGNNVLIIVNSIELAVQAATAVSRAYPHLLVEIEQGAKFKANGFADVTVATYQTLVRSGGNDGQERLSKFDPRRLKGIIVDEAHHAASKSYIHLLSRFDDQVGLSREQREIAKQDSNPEADPTTKPIPIIGFSATFSRHDGLALGQIFDRIVYHRDFLEMIDEQWLCPIRFTAIKANLDLTAVRVSPRSGDFLPRSLSSMTNTPVINRLIVGSWLKKTGSTRRSTLVFATDVQHTMDLTVEYRKAGIDARYLHGGTSIKERKQLLADFKAGQYPVLINCAILTEGFDLPQIDCVVLARPTRSKNLFSQMIGRGLRLSPGSGKQDCLVLDLVGSVERGVVCTPTLFGLDLNQEGLEDLENASIDDLKEKLAEGNRDSDDGMGISDPLALHHQQDPTKVTFINYDSPHELQAALNQSNNKSSEIIARLSPNAWVHCGSSVFILDIPRKGFLRVEPANDPPTLPDSSRRWSATWTRQNADFEESQAATGNDNHFVPYRRPISIISSDNHTHDTNTTATDDPTSKPLDLETTIRLCDNFATTKILHSNPINSLIRRDAPWRKTPATASQRALVQKRLKGKGKNKDSINDEEKDESTDLTKGKASEILTRLKFGFKKRWESEVRAWNKLAKEKEKELKRIQRETVQVGDL